jgi:hypothetical protein
LSQVRSKVEETVRRLFRDIPNLKIGVVSHGDYCDGPNVLRKIDLTNDMNQICNFIKTAPATGGGDAPECYELVLNEARTFTWDAGATRSLVLIGDDVPHSPYEAQNAKKLDWRNEIKLLLESGINVYGVQALRRAHATSFYKEIAQVTGGFHLQLDQFSSVTDLLLAVCYNQQGPEALQRFEKEVEDQGRLNRQTDSYFSTLSGRTPRFVSYSSPDPDYWVPTSSARSTRSSKPTKAVYTDGSIEVDKRLLVPVSPSRFQVLDVFAECSIQDFVTNNGLLFEKGKGFYQFTETVKVQDHKEIVLVDKKTGDMFTGKGAREMLGLPESGTVSLRPGSFKDFDIFIQSTSINRKLLNGTSFLYEVDMSR